MPALCPKCRADALHHSRVRSWIERIRRGLSGQVPFRCHACDWRGWLAEPTSSAQTLREIHRDLTDAEIERLELGDSDDGRH